MREKGEEMRKISEILEGASVYPASPPKEVVAIAKKLAAIVGLEYDVAPSDEGGYDVVFLSKGGAVALFSFRVIEGSGGWAVDKQVDILGLKSVPAKIK